MIKRECIRCELDFEKVISYFIDHIQCGKTLSKRIIEKINFHQGIFFTLLPSNAELNRLLDFTHGGIIPPILYGSKTYIDESLKDFQPQQVITMDQEYSEFIAAYVNGLSENCAIVENYIVEPDSPYAIIKNVRMISYNNEVYYLLDKKNSVKEIYETIRKSGQVWHSLSVLTQSRIKKTIVTLSDENLDQICDNAKFVVAGAYDGEGYIFWEKKL